MALFDQQNDIGEKTNVAAQHPDIAHKIGDYLRTARRDSTDWEPRWPSPPKAAPKKTSSQNN